MSGPLARRSAPAEPERSVPASGPRASPDDLLRTAAGREASAACAALVDLTGPDTPAADLAHRVYEVLADRLFGDARAVADGPVTDRERHGAHLLHRAAEREGWLRRPATHVPLTRPDPAATLAEAPSWEVAPAGAGWGLTAPASAWAAAVGARLSTLRPPLEDAATGRATGTATPGPVLELHRPDDWTALCRLHPRPLDPDGKAEWRAWFGDEPLVLPDWAALARSVASVWFSPWLFAATEGALLAEGGLRTALVGVEPGQVLLLRAGSAPRG